MILYWLKITKNFYVLDFGYNLIPKEVLTLSVINVAKSNSNLLLGKNGSGEIWGTGRLASTFCLLYNTISSNISSNFLTELIP